MSDENPFDVSSNAALDELTSETLGSQESSDSPTDQTPSTPGQEPQAAAQTPQPTPQEPTPQAGQPTAVELDGVIYSLEDLKAMRTTAQQLPHLQGRYAELKRVVDEQKAAKAAQPEQAPAPITASQVAAHYAPMVQETVGQGFIEEDFAALYPNTAANMLMYRDVITGLTRIANVVAEKIGTQDRTATEQSEMTSLAQGMLSLTAQGDAFAPLAQPEVREAFFAYLWDINPETRLLHNPEFLSRQWVAFNHQQFLSGKVSAPAQVQPTAKPKSNVRPFVRGEGGGSRPSAPAPTEKTPLDDFVSEFFGTGR